MVPRLDPVIHQPTRLQIMALLYRNRQASFTDLRDGLGLTPGNLASHAATLEEAGYVTGGRVLVDLSFQVRYRITEAGAAAFVAYLGALRDLLASVGAPPSPAPAASAAPAPADGDGPPAPT